MTKPSAAELASALVRASSADAAELVLVQPPFASPDRPSLGLHILQRVAEARGVRASVLYCNLSFARLIGPGRYRELCHTPTEDLAGERLFRRAWPPAAIHGAGRPPERWSELSFSSPGFEELQYEAESWTAAMAHELAMLSAPMIGFSSTFEQTTACLGLIVQVRRLAPDKLLLLGGANADDLMGSALAELVPELDHVFQGEAEASFAEFLDSQAAGRASPRVIAGQVTAELDAIPPPDYADFFDQWHALIDASHVEDGLSKDEIRLPYESSRGCWWGAKHHCTFCGLNANGMTHRSKSPDKVAFEIRELSERNGIDRILMTDNIMPHSYFTTLLPRLAAAEKKLEIFYEQKANIGRTRMALLRDAGVTAIQPGIESLSTRALRRMSKGTSLRINLECLRHARAAGISVAWNLLSDFPEDTAEEYEAMIGLIPLLHHLEPPGGLGGLSIDRFSPYFQAPSDHGIAAIRPLPAYAEVYPGTDAAPLAYHFEGDYVSALRTDRDLRDRLASAVDGWGKAWRESAPLLFVFDLGQCRYLLVDTRLAGTGEPRLLDEAEAHLLLEGAGEVSHEVFTLLDRNQLVEAEGRFLPLACAALDGAVWAQVAH